MKTRHLALLSLLALALAACGPRPQPIPEDTVVPTTPAQPTPSESPLPQPGISPISPLPTPPADLLAAAVTYLATELDIPSEQVTVLYFEAVEWPDASLGCPQPGMVYAQVITPGYRFLLEAAWKEYEVHTDDTGKSVVICQPASGDLSDPEAAFQALLAHLAQAYPGFGLDQQEEAVVFQPAAD